MKLKDVLPKLIAKPESSQDEVRKLVAVLKAKAKENNPDTDKNSTNPAAPLALGADSKQTY